MEHALTIRRVEPGDCRLLWDWVNDPAVRAASFRSDPVGWDTHVAWFQGRRVDPKCRIYLILDSTRQPLGQVRFDLKPDQCAEVDLSIARIKRGRGLGAKALQLACTELLREMIGVNRFIARIKPSNATSIRTFESAGFACSSGVWVRQASAPKQRKRALRASRG